MTNAMEILEKLQSFKGAIKLNPPMVCHAAIDMKSLNKKERIITGWVSTPRKDRHGEAIEPIAFKETLDDYMGNPVMFYNHWADIIIGNDRELKVDDEKGLWHRSQISKVTDLANMVWDLVEERMIHASSFGFIPHIIQDADDKDNERNVDRYLKLDMVEHTIATIPANAEALFSMEKMLKYGNDIVETEVPVTEDNIEARLARIDEIIAKSKTAGRLKAVDAFSNAALIEGVENSPVLLQKILYEIEMMKSRVFPAIAMLKAFGTGQGWFGVSVYETGKEEEEKDDKKAEIKDIEEVDEKGEEEEKIEKDEPVKDKKEVDEPEKDEGFSETQLGQIKQVVNDVIFGNKEKDEKDEELTEDEERKLDEINESLESFDDEE